MSRTIRHAGQGFTFIELMIVVAIAAILIVIAAPSFADFLAKRRIEGTMAELVTDVQFARSEAVSRNEAVRMTFGTGCYVIHRAVISGSAAAVSCTRATKSINPAVAEIKTVQLDANRPVALVPMVTFFEFDPVRGMASNNLSPAADGRVDVCVKNPSNETCGTAAKDWRLQAVLTLMGRVETCSPSGTGYFSGYASNCS
jgi:prepilin-type N-terminal cleavage/methylation domain-containing protein